MCRKKFTKEHVNYQFRFRFTALLTTLKTSFHMFRYEFAETLMVFCEASIYVLTSAKKGTNVTLYNWLGLINLYLNVVGLLEVLKEENAPYELRFLTISKADNKAHFDTIFEAIKQSKNGVYHLILRTITDIISDVFKII